MVEAVFYHPGLKWRIRRIHVLSPIRFTNIRRNEIKSKAPYRAARNAMQGEGRELYIAASQDMTQRAALILQDVHYVIEAHFEMTDRAAPGDNPGKFQDIVTRRMERGQCYHTPYLGCREFPAYFRRWPGGPVPAIEESRELGLMPVSYTHLDDGVFDPLLIFVYREGFGAHRDGLQQGNRLSRFQILNDTASHQGDGDDQIERDEDVDDDSRHIHPEAAQPVGLDLDKAPDQSE